MYDWKAYAIILSSITESFSPFSSNVTFPERLPLSTQATACCSVLLQIDIYLYLIRLYSLSALVLFVKSILVSVIWLLFFLCMCYVSAPRFQGIMAVSTVVSSYGNCCHEQLHTSCGLSSSTSAWGRQVSMAHTLVEHISHFLDSIIKKFLRDR